MKKNFEARHGSQIPNVQLNDLVLVRQGLLGTNSNFLCPFRVVKMSSQQGILKTIGYRNSDANSSLPQLAIFYFIIPGGMSLKVWKRKETEEDKD